MYFNRQYYKKQQRKRAYELPVAVHKIFFADNR